MIPLLHRFPPQAVTRIPGPRQAFGSRRARVTFGLPNVSGQEGMPSGDMINTFFSNNAGAPTWFAVSDGGLGFIPWGFWQVACYPLGELPVSAINNLATTSIEINPLAPSAAVAGSVFGAFSGLRGNAVGLGFKRAKEFKIGDRIFLPLDPANPGGQVFIDAPFGVTNLQGFYSGGFYLGQGEAPLAMMQVSPGYDNPLFLALWSPGNRAILPLSEAPPPSPYGGYPYPSEPPAYPIVG